MEGVVEDALSPPKDLSLIVKGKRTKRLRPHSPIPFTIAIPSSPNYNPTTTMISLKNNASPQPSSSEEGCGTTTKEDEDMANCLIILSQGNPKKDSPTMNLDHVQYGPPPPNVKFNSKRYIEAPISSNGKAGMYVYQCKTCGRTFPSFQALGGHRASHKKPKNMVTTSEAKKISSSPLVALSDDQEEESFKINNYKSKKPPALSLELNYRGGYSNLSTSDITNKSPLPKIHECSYCGAEFSSGQALGGHMRRHRGPVAPTTPSTNTTLSLSPLPISPASINQDSDQDAERKKPINALSLDLNLPAPEDHDVHGKDSKFAMASKHGNHQQIHQKQQQDEPEPALVLSTRRFVECHY